MKLSDAERQLVLELARNPVFTGLMEKISTSSDVPKWKKGDDEATKHAAWINKSGFVEGRDYVLKLLRYEHE